MVDPISGLSGADTLPGTRGNDTILAQGGCAGRLAILSLAAAGSIAFAAAPAATSCLVKLMVIAWPT